MSRRLGQVFLKNKHIQKQIADYVLGLDGDRLVEIGPGSGAITTHIYEQRGRDLMMVEIDERLIGHLKSAFPESQLIHGDILEVEFGELGHTKKNILFGNIPYYITSPIIFKFLENGVFSDAVFMVQKEYYETISAECKTNRYSCMSALVQSFVSLKKVLDVDRKHFYPIPKVDSTVVHLSRDKNCDVDLEKYSLFLRKCFGMPRKTLWNNLRKHFDQSRIEQLFREKEIQMNIRPEERDHRFFVELFRCLDC